MNSNQFKYYHRHLPHYFVPEACYFITYRLAGSLPKIKLKQIRSYYTQSLQRIKSESISEKIKLEKTTNEWKKYFNKIDNLLTRYSQSPLYLQNDSIATIVSDSLKFYDNEEYDLYCFCIMPNHVHCVLKLFKTSRLLEKIMQSIKRYSAVKANKILRRTGQFWQHENYDHIIRNEKELVNIINYILNNPVKANLTDNYHNWKWNYFKSDF